MNFADDIAVIETEVRGGDPAFDRVPMPEREAALNHLRCEAQHGDRDRFLLAGMGVVALAGNGHSRVMPNTAVSVIPQRIVMRDGHPALVEGTRATRILTVDGLPCAHVLAAWDPVLAGNVARRRVLSGLMLGWPAALRHAGCGTGPDIRYRLVTGAERRYSSKDDVPALPLYPFGETGALVPGVDDFGLPDGAVLAMRRGLWWWRIGDLAALDAADVVQGVAAMADDPTANVVVDLRGNPGGSFLKMLPLITWLRGHWKGGRCAVLVNEYTFSAAIVTAALLAHHVGARLFGADMGDDLAFHAEGGTADLPDSGAHLRHSTAWHDWATGHADKTTPDEIARHLIAAGPLHVKQVVRAMQEDAACAFALGA
ncbi:hypothetical protein ACERZ8_17750 [Tateyamaria armeniaca]|uniref:Peptidase S41 n=1 Tax=Tateyamaria armeniaca TaxID=2518930 RepID=A0ABW8V0W6_9RHOB